MSSWGLAHVPDPLAKSENSSYHDIGHLKLRNAWDQNLPLAPDLVMGCQPSVLSTVTMWLHGCECLQNNHRKKSVTRGFRGIWGSFCTADPAGIIRLSDSPVKILP